MAQASKLDAESTDRLNRLCLTPSQHPHDWGEADVGPQVPRLMDGWEHQSAFVFGPALGILAGNSLATALHSGFEAFGNLARNVFVDPAGRAFYRE
ncbi:MmyB family transcriptional regulator [Streptomyces sp. SAS_260]|uniref:MmyB family transcriptional regulator n=1 Tax=Streptomyces sp. SAS_260 TaxID=3412751 RepID=UPI00403D3240